MQIIYIKKNANHCESNHLPTTLFTIPFAIHLFPEKNQETKYNETIKHIYIETLGGHLKTQTFRTKIPCHFRCTLRLLKAFFQRLEESSGGGSERGKSRDGPYFLVENLFPKKGKMGETLVFHRRSASNHQFLSLGWLQSYEFLFFLLESDSMIHTGH